MAMRAPFETTTQSCYQPFKDIEIRIAGYHDGILTGGNTALLKNC